MAEMNVPAWPIPIHQTKLMMAKAQATGMLLPHRPMPMQTVAVTATTRSAKKTDEIATPAHQRMVRGVHTGERSWSDSSASVEWPRMTSLVHGLLDLGVGVVDAGQVLGARARPQLVEHLEGARLLAPLRPSRVPVWRSEPNWMACVGQACWQAVTTSPGRMSRSSTRAWISASRMRCTQ